MSNSRIDFNEFTSWVTNDIEIQEFLVEAMGYQTREHAIKLYQTYLDKYLECFSKAAGIKVNFEEEEKIATVFYMNTTID